MTFASSSSTAQKFKFDSCSIDRSIEDDTEQPRRAQPSSNRRLVDAFAFVVAIALRARRAVTRVVVVRFNHASVCFDVDES